jgi:hypothetical protein
MALKACCGLGLGFQRGLPKIASCQLPYITYCYENQDDMLY